MDRTTKRAADTMLADLANTGGGTYESGTLLPFTPKVGFAVGLGGVHFPASMVTAKLLVQYAKAVTTEHEASFVGTWLDKGIVYIDAVVYYGSHARRTAIEQGREAGQQAIFDFSTGEDITL